MQNRQGVLKQFYSIFLIFNVLILTVPTFAQTRRGSAQAANNQPTQTQQKCSGAWTGVITYTRTQTNSDSTTVERVSGRGKDTRDWQMKYDYKASVAVIESPERNGTSIGKGSINHNFSSTEKIHAVEKNSCDRGKTWRDMSGNSTARSEINGTGKVEANVHIGINTDGTYAVSVGLPSIKGLLKGSTSSSFSGQCTPKEGANFSMPATETTIDGNSLASDGTDRINPNDPTRISGSYSKTYLGVTETITWNLQKCGAPLRITDLKFEHPRFPNFNDWQEIAEKTGTIDGNMVRIKAKILNASGDTKNAELKFVETFEGDKWNGTKPDEPLDENKFSVSLDPGEEQEVEMIWDTSGYAWFDDGRPRLVQRIKAELEENGKKADAMTKTLKIAPKPLVLVHGLWSSWKAWELWQNLLTTVHSYDWKAFPVGEKPEKGIMNTGGGFMSPAPTNSIFENSQQLGKYIRYAQEDRNAWHVDLVAHSMGGLISRHYIHQFMPVNSPDGRPQITHLVMLGTPNMGSPCADVMNFAFEMTGNHVEAIRQLKPSVVAEFNRVNTNRKGVKFSVLAGNPLPVMCKTVVWNDTVVPVESAIWKIKDHALSKDIHTDLYNAANFSKFVLPRLKVGPKDDHNPEAPELGQNPQQLGAFFRNASFRPEISDDSDKPDFAKAVKIEPKQTIEIEIPVKEAENFGLTFMADPSISATLFNEKGMITGKNLTKTPEANAWFRSIYIDQKVSAGIWKLKLENTSDKVSDVVLATWNAVVKR